MFTTTLPLIFSFTHLFAPVEFVFFLLVVFGAVWLSAPAVDISWEDHRLDTSIRLFLHSAWLGHASLWRVFWPFFILVNAILLRVDYLILESRFTIPSWDTAHMVLVLPIVWWGVGVWKCSQNTSAKIWNICARFVVLCMVIEYVLKFIIRKDYPQIIFNCSELLIIYGDCI